MVLPPTIRRELCNHKIFGFKMKKGEDPVRALCGLEDLAARMENATIPIDSDTVYTCFMNGLLKSEYEQEIRDIGLMENYVREEIVRLVPNRCETLKQRQGQNGTSDSYALLAQSRGNGRRGVRGGRGGGRGGGRRSGREGSNGGAAGEDARNLDSVTC